MRQWTDALAAVLGTQAYSPFGEPLSGLAVAPWGFTGEWHDPSGLVYLRARWYNAALGRFAQVDPFPGTLASPALQHPYSYGLNDPLLYTDPGGRLGFLATIGIRGLIGATVSGVGYVLANPGRSPGEYLHDRAFARALGVGFVSGALAGAVGFGLDKLLPAAATLTGAMLCGALVGGATSAVGQVVTNRFMAPCSLWYAGVPEAAWGAVGGGISAGVGWWFRNSPCGLPWDERGLAAEGRRGANLPPGHPKLDRHNRWWSPGTATSTKSMDLTAPGYQQHVSRVTSTVHRYVRAVAAFAGTNVVPVAQIARRELELIIPAVGETAAQRAVVAAAKEWAWRTYDVVVSVVRMR